MKLQKTEISEFQVFILKLSTVCLMETHCFSFVFGVCVCRGGGGGGVRAHQGYFTLFESSQL